VQGLNEAIKRITIFSDLNPTELDVLTARMKEKTAQKGDIVFLEGEEGNELYAIIEGSIRTVVLLPNGEEFPLADFKAGGFFGDMAIIEDAVRSATCIATAGCRLASLSRDDFNALIR
jgi:CRP-like cAMP-binding protein